MHRPSQRVVVSLTLSTSEAAAAVEVSERSIPKTVDLFVVEARVPRMKVAGAAWRKDLSKA